MKTTVVIDIGCSTYQMPNGGIVDSVTPLIERFQPLTLYGFDPSPGQPNWNGIIGNTSVRLQRLAAWTEDTILDFDPRNLGSTVMREKNLWGEWRAPKPTHVQAFDFPAWFNTVSALLSGHDMIVKFDCEGAEFPIIAALIEQGLDERISLLAVEWHDDVMAPQSKFKRQKAKLLASLHCPVEEWKE